MRLLSYGPNRIAFTYEAWLASCKGCFLQFSCWAEGLCALRIVFGPGGCVHLGFGFADPGWVPDLTYLVGERGSQLGMWMEMCSPTWPILQ